MEAISQELRPILVRVPEATAREIERQARLNDRSVNRELVRALRERYAPQLVTEAGQ